MGRWVVFLIFVFEGVFGKSVFYLGIRFFVLESLEL